jgi:hypothetical protein
MALAAEFVTDALQSIEELSSLCADTVDGDNLVSGWLRWDVVCPHSLDCTTCKLLGLWDEYLFYYIPFKATESFVLTSSRFVQF